MTDLSNPRLNDSLIENMLAERAGSRAPADLARSIASAIEATPQRHRRWWSGVGAPVTSRQWVALVVTLAVAAAGAGLLLRSSPVPVAAPTAPPSMAPVVTPALSPSPAPSATATPRRAAVIAYINWVDYTNGWSPTGRIWIAGTDGSGPHELFPGGRGNQSGVAWSPDGSRLVYGEAPGPGVPPGAATVPGLYLTDASGSAPKALDPACVPTACYDGSAAFSLDGTRLVLLRGHGQVSVSGSIAIMDLASGQVVELGSTATIGPEGPRWSPDGKRIVFFTTDKMRNGSAVFTVDANGQNLRQLSSPTLPARLPDWSPDGSRIVFTSLVNTIVRVAGTDTMQTIQDVYTVRPDWTDLRRLTTDGSSGGATWTPDGRIMFTRECSVPRPTGGPSTPDCSASGLWTMDADGSNARLIVPGGNGFNGPLVGLFDAAWQPTP